MRAGHTDAVTRLIPTMVGPMLAEATATGVSRVVRAGHGPDGEPARRPAGGGSGGRAGSGVDAGAGVGPGADGAAGRHLDRLADQLDAYFAGALREFDVPVDWAAAGVDEGFSREVYREIRSVPYGDTASYGQISIDAGRPRNARRVGRLCSLVPVSFLIPVHRITRADGGLGACPEFRRGLLAHEQRNLHSPEPVAIDPM